MGNSPELSTGRRAAPKARKNRVKGLVRPAAQRGHGPLTRMLLNSLYVWVGSRA